MVKNIRLMAIAGAILLVVAGVVVASNMGFKHVPDRTPTDFVNDIFDISYPLYNSYATNEDLWVDLEAACGPGTCAEVFSLDGDFNSNSWCGAGSSSHPTYPGGMVRIHLASNSPCNTWAIIGSHNPNFTYSFTGISTAAKLYPVSVPYHTTAIDLKGILHQIPFSAEIRIYHPDQSSDSWFDGDFGTNASLRIGDAVWIGVSAPTTWTPSHY